VDFGSKVPRGRLPVFSVADEAEARRLLVLACPKTDDGQFYAPELADEQTLENLDRFSDRLDRAHAVLMRTGGCRCTPTGAK